MARFCVRETSRAGSFVDGSRLPVAQGEYTHTGLSRPTAGAVGWTHATLLGAPTRVKASRGMQSCSG